MLIRDDVLQFVYQAAGRPMYDESGSRVELPDHIRVPLENFLRASHRVGVTVPNPEILAQLVALAELWATKPGNKPALLPAKPGEDVPDIVARYMAGHIKAGDRVRVQWRNKLAPATLISLNASTKNARVQIDNDHCERSVAAHLVVVENAEAAVAS